MGWGLGEALSLCVCVCVFEVSFMDMGHLCVMSLCAERWRYERCKAQRSGPPSVRSINRPTERSQKLLKEHLYNE